METQNIDLKEFACPLCGKPLASHEYDKAMGELTRKVAQTYDKQTVDLKKQYDDQLKQVAASHKQELDSLRVNQEKTRKELKKELEDSYRGQLSDLKKTYEKVGKEGQKRFAELEKKMRAEYKSEIKKKEGELASMEKEQARMRKLGFDEAESKSKAEIKRLEISLGERDIQIRRFEGEVESLNKKLAQSQSELKGEAGELDLYLVLTQAFSQDTFRRQTRGTQSGDIIQRIRTETTTLDTPIVYDNKQAESVTKKDIDKAKNYQKIHSTNYVIIVSSNLPKKDVQNGLYGEREGILLVHPSIVVEVAQQIRKAITEIARQSQSAKDRETKEAKLYDYMKSQDFAGTLERLHRIHQSMTELQDKEEKVHERLWKERKALQSQINKAYIEISGGIDSIMQDKSITEEIPEKSYEKDQQEHTLELLEPITVKPKKKKIDHENTTQS
ncbi:MAG: DUF2130 domain-containing protein [Thaumarchaeota archaeon]|nr:DUF2130 domain-containing protein [Nitrososphaerota archaeon]